MELSGQFLGNVIISGQVKNATFFSNKCRLSRTLTKNAGRPRLQFEISVWNFRNKSWILIRCRHTFSQKKMFWFICLSEVRYDLIQGIELVKVAFPWITSMFEKWLVITNMSYVFMRVIFACSQIWLRHGQIIDGTKIDAFLYQIAIKVLFVVESNSNSLIQFQTDCFSLQMTGL